MTQKLRIWSFCEKTATVFILAYMLLMAGNKAVLAQCDTTTPSFTIDLSGDPAGIWTSPPVSRSGKCCGISGSDVCIKFVITINANAEGLIFDIIGGAMPTGSLFYTIDCKNPTPIGNAICLKGTGPHTLTFCKPGDNPNIYIVKSIPKPDISPSVTIKEGCSDKIFVKGLDIGTINWTSIYPGPEGAYNYYLDCQNGCDTVIVSPTSPFPAYVDYVACGLPESQCLEFYTCDTVRVYMKPELNATISAAKNVICYEDTATVLYIESEGGAPPYTYSWNTGDTSDVLIVTPGTYSVTVNDITNCNPVIDSVTIIKWPEITLSIGPNQQLCLDELPVSLTAVYTAAAGVIWSGGSGSFLPSFTSDTITYVPTSQEISNGTVFLTATTAGTQGCPPKTASVTITIYPVPNTSQIIY